MGEFHTDSKMEQWVCPNDRQLALRARLGTGWSVHTSKLSEFKKGDQLSEDEQEQIMRVIKRAEIVERNEMERVGRLVERVDNMKKNAIGNGSSQCILCGNEFGLLGASPTFCGDCKKAVCTKCGVDTINSQRQPLWMCKICSEKRELWKRSGAWFFKGIPKYVIPSTTTKKPERFQSPLNKYPPARDRGTEGQRTVAHGQASHGGRTYNTWSKSGSRQLNESSEQENSSDSDDDISIGKRRTTKTDDITENDEVIGSGQNSQTIYGSHSYNDRPNRNRGPYPADRYNAASAPDRARNYNPESSQYK